jgi:putative endonuclease
MFYVYILSNKEGVLYTGFTSNLKKRFVEHNNGKSFFTKSRGPWKLIFYEAYLNKYDALRREKYLKSSKGKTTVQTMLKEYLSKNI